MTREPGCYWVKVNSCGKWEVADFDGDRWALFYDDYNGRVDSDFTEINETRILNPDERGKGGIDWGKPYAKQVLDMVDDRILRALHDVVRKYPTVPPLLDLPSDTKHVKNL